SYEIPNELTNLHMGIAVRHDFYVIFKEAVNNLAKYSNATEAQIQLEYMHQYLTLTIKDNGKGFDANTVVKGNGLKNIQNRSKKIGAVYSLHSTPGTGTTVKLQMKL